jgi:hypothetical protein
MEKYKWGLAGGIPMSEKNQIIDEEEFEKMSLVEKWRYLAKKREEIERRVRRLIREKE